MDGTQYRSTLMNSSSRRRGRNDLGWGSPRSDDRGDKRERCQDLNWVAKHGSERKGGGMRD